ncbi:hypothetical protein [Sphingomonas mollis]|uniref:TetR family transcriptional regulator n=1 Tax=Sphingomonas mollis TaxID=2795726 RepID=A0ABS0XPS9_9SPHN|nr:hypothetical protein [Sphingomonas sp. BT553]MBJ6122047.1 hypothetical protein [Sphingomonas sp. BT553]
MRKYGLHEGDAAPGITASAGQAALLLVESLIHELVANGRLPLDRAIAVVEIATDTAGQIALAQCTDQADDPVGDLLRVIARTLSLDADAPSSTSHG